MIFFLHGADTFRSRQKLHEVKEKFVREVDPARTNLVVLDGATMKSEDFRNAVSAMSMFVRKRMVVVERLLEHGKKDVQEGVAEYLESKEFPDEHIIIFWEGKSTESKNHRIKKIVSKKRGLAASSKQQAATVALLPLLLRQKYVQEFTLLSGIQLVQWIQAHIKEVDGTIETKAIDELVMRIGGDLWRMDQEIQKLVAYRNKERITSADVQEHVHGMFEEKIFALCDALGTQERGRALTLIRAELTHGVHPLYLLTMMVRHFRILLMVREGLDTGGTEKSLATTLALHPFVLGKAVRQVALYTRERLRAIYGRLFVIERKLKTTPEDPEALFTAFVAGLV
ncbi:DNA polymerase III subunit delta [Candidatus Uhrbacteria bacterium]|nr:DNA polymerase III subunit delta [Candidatus Uhrbacteria bacterium]